MVGRSQVVLSGKGCARQNPGGTSGTAWCMLGQRTLGVTRAYSSRMRRGRRARHSRLQVWPGAGGEPLRAVSRVCASVRCCWPWGGGWAPSPGVVPEPEWRAGVCRWPVEAGPRSVYFCVVTKCDLCVPPVRDPPQLSPATSPDVPVSFIMGPNGLQTSGFWS